MLPIRPTSRFKKDLKRAARQGHDLDKLKHALQKLAIPEALPPEFKDHKLNQLFPFFPQSADPFHLSALTFNSSA